MGLHASLQRGIEALFFQGRSTHASEYATYVLGNIILMLLVFFVLLNTIGYDWTGQLYPEGLGYSLATGLDDAIPLVPQFVIFYVYLFYSFAIVTMLLFGFVEYRKGYALGWSLVALNAVALVVYIVFPVSTFWWRQEYLANPVVGNIWYDQVYAIWAGDTSFNCFPSLHAAVSTVCLYAWYRYSRVKPNIKTRTAFYVVFFMVAGVILSTLFVKQHYIADEVAGIILALAVGKILFDRLWKQKE